MKLLRTGLLAVTLAGLTGCITLGQPYASVGAAYKLSEQQIWVEADGTSMNDPFTARGEIGIEHDNFRYGVSHHSQWLRGKPFDDDIEYHKTEVFIDYVWRF